MQVDKTSLKLAFLAWELERRAEKNNFLTYDECDQLQPEEVAEGSADKLWSLLASPTASESGATSQALSQDTSAPQDRQL